MALSEQDRLEVDMATHVRDTLRAAEKARKRARHALDGARNVINPARWHLWLKRSVGVDPRWAELVAIEELPK